MLQGIRLPFHFLSTMFIMAKQNLTRVARVKWLWVTDFSPNECTRDQSPVEMKRQRECPEDWVAELMWLNLISLPKIQRNM